MGVSAHKNTGMGVSTRARASLYIATTSAKQALSKQAKRALLLSTQQDCAYHASSFAALRQNPAPFIVDRARRLVSAAAARLLRVGGAALAHALATPDVVGHGTHTGLVAQAILHDTVASLARRRAPAVHGRHSQSIEHHVVLLAEVLSLVALEHLQLLRQRRGGLSGRSHHDHGHGHQGRASDERRHHSRSIRHPGGLKREKVE